MELFGSRKRFNCSVIDFYDKRVMATLKYIDVKLTLDTLSLGFSKHAPNAG